MTVLQARGLTVYISMALLTCALATTANAAAGASAKPPAKQPDLLNCSKLSWMASCSELNETARRNPSAPLRIVDQTGLEFQFAPGTPSAMIQYMLNPTKESARAYRKWQDDMYARAQLAAATMVQVNLEDGVESPPPFPSSTVGADGYKPGTSPAPAVSSKGASSGTINYQNIKVWVVYDSKCQACKMLLPEVTTLAGRHPKLNLTLLQLDDDADFVETLRANGLKAGIVSSKDRPGIMAQVTKTPTIWVQDERSKRSSLLTGYAPVADIEAKLVSLSQ